MKRFNLAAAVLCLLVAGPALAQVCVVTNNSGGSGPGSLGDCVNQANAYPGAFSIFFQIPNSMAPSIVADTGYTITNSRGVTIDGSSQPGTALNTNPALQPLNTQLVVSVSVNPDPGPWRGIAVFDIQASNVTIRGLNIQGGPLFGVAICYQPSGPSIPCQNNRIQGNFIGTDITGAQPRPSGWLAWNPPYGAGVYLGSGASNNFIGIDFDGINDAAERNLISGQVPAPSPGGGMIGHGVLIDGISDAPQNTHIIGNLIGTTFDLADVIPNNYGITMLGSADSGLIAANVIAGNNLDGIWSGSQAGSMGGVVRNFTIMVNAVGLDPNTNTPLPNGQDGIHLEPGTQTFSIGLPDDWNTANVISANGRYGVYLYGAFQPNTRDIGIYRNLIGTDTSGAAALGNSEAGVFIAAVTTTNQVGSSAGDGLPGNVISGNGGSGIYLLDADQTALFENFVGSNFAGDSPVPNGGSGVALACSDIGCCDDTRLEGNQLRFNAEHGLALYGQHTNTVITNNNLLNENGVNGLLAMVNDNSNRIDNSEVADNGAEGVFLVGSAMIVQNCDITGNTGWGVASIPYYGSTRGPGGAGDDYVAEADVLDCVIDANGQGGIIGQDTEFLNGTDLSFDNTIGDNNGNLDVLQAWFGAVEILDTSFAPIASGSYQVNLSDGLGYSLDGSTPDGGLWGPDGGGTTPAFTYDDVYTWFFVPAYLVDNAGNFHQANPWTVTVVGPTSGQAVYTFDGVNNDSSLGGQPAGIDTMGEFRYQVAEVVTDTDSDADGVIDTDDCAPNDSAYQGPSGTPCDADSDGYCDAAISGQVQRSFCPNDCAAIMCDPSDCDDTSSAVNPGVTEGPFGSLVCGDGIDNDCDLATDIVDDGCWECAADADCDDGNVCNGAETCVGNLCQAGTALDCDDGDVCTTDSCDPSSGCQYAFNTEPCDDGLFCTVQDACDGAGNCGGQARDCSSEADQCNDGVCDEDQDACVKQPLADDTACDDGDVCTMSDSCQSGTCQGDPLDQDGDGYVAELCGGDDCNDSLAAVNPGATEGPAGDATCTDTLDNDCDTAVDGDDSGCVVVDQCGDGVRTGSEACDDGNTDSGDGCDGACAIEDGWACRTGVEPNLCGHTASPGDIVVTEIMNNPACVGDSDGEWFEIYNASGRDLVLGGWLLSDLDGESDMVNLQLSLPAAGYLVLCRNADSGANGGVSCDYQFSGYQLANGSDEIVVSDAADTVIDQVAYDDGATFPDPNGASMSLDPNATTSSANDDGANWCEAASAIEGGCGDLGTPGAANPSCTVCPDDDGDGFGAASCGGSDCDDTDAAVNPDAAEVPCDGKDNDCSEATPDDSDPSDSDGDGFSVGCGADCDDTDAAVYPGAEEICDDTIDQDCNGADLPCDCPDADSDGFADATCGGADCDDADASVNPGASEVTCDGIDNDCNPASGDDSDPTDNDGDGYSLGCGADCDDDDATINPGATETCDDNIDQDCNGSDLQCGCPDADSDGVFDATCGGDDCDDSDAAVHPGADEVCDAADNNCDGSTDEGFGQLTCGEGACQVTVDECRDGQLQQCQPLDPPETSEVTCTDGVDNDCDGLTDADDEDCQGCGDADGDGYQDSSCGGDDCDDDDAAVHPGAEELCTDGIDNDCNGLLDFDDSEVCKRGSSGCGCATGEPRAAGWLLVGLLVLLRRRRRKLRR